VDKDRELIERLSANLRKLIENDHKTYFRSFALGVCYGLGATIGVAVVLATLGFVLRSLGGLPMVGDWINGLNQNLQNTNINLY